MCGHLTKSFIQDGGFLSRSDRLKGFSVLGTGVDVGVSVCGFCSLGGVVGVAGIGTGGGSCSAPGVGWFRVTDVFC